MADINPDEDGNGLVPNLLGRVSATIQASPTITAHIFDADNYDGGELLKRDAMPNGIYTERVDADHVAVFVPLSAFIKGKVQPAVSSLASAGVGSVEVVTVRPTATMPMSSAPTPAATGMPSDNIYLRIVVPSHRQGGTDQGAHGGAGRQRRLHVVRPEHVQTIQAMFPEIPEAAIRADLARTGSPVITSDNILRNGGTLPLPAAAPGDQRTEAVGGNAGTGPEARVQGQRTGAAMAGGSSSGGGGGAASSSGVMLNASHSPLVNRMRIAKDGAADAGPLPPAPPKVWESDSDKRSDILRKRKEFMLMEARKKYLEKQKQGQQGQQAPVPAEEAPASSTA
ncbi:hypothetical protein GGI07_004129 [Coemansia sp. Benny D115]|nr:hypothetical protein GGI07_004129 [Coemansia sp. Benny D115]